MSTASLTDRDLQLRDDVMRRLELDPDVNASQVGVTAGDGTVTLSGYIDTYDDKLRAERAAKEVRGVRAVANDLEVRLKLEHPDPDIAADVVRALRLRHAIPENVQAAVHMGHVTLTGKVSWLFQKDEAERALRHLHGVRSIRNHISVLPRATEIDVRRRIIEALHRNADVDARQITVSVTDGSVLLAGCVGTSLQRESAERAAAAAPGIIGVDNRIVIQAACQPSTDADGEIC